MAWTLTPDMMDPLLADPILGRPVLEAMAGLRDPNLPDPGACLRMMGYDQLPRFQRDLLKFDGDTRGMADYFERIRDE